MGIFFRNPDAVGHNLSRFCVTIYDITRGACPESHQLLTLLTMVDATSNLNQKRRRPDESRDENLYFEDGSIIISANNHDVDRDLVYFRVHKSVLSKQSTVFGDMFTLPSPSDLDTYDSLPLVHVHDDAKDLKQFLQAIYDPR